MSKVCLNVLSGPMKVENAFAVSPTISISTFCTVCSSFFYFCKSQIAISIHNVAWKHSSSSNLKASLRKVQNAVAATSIKVLKSGIDSLFNRVLLLFSRFHKRINNLKIFQCWYGWVVHWFQTWCGSIAIVSVFQFFPVSYTHLTLPTIYSV